MDGKSTSIPRLTGIENRWSRARSAATWAAAAMTLYFAVFALAKGAGWNVVRVSALSAGFVFILMWTIQVPSVAHIMNRPAGRLLYLVLMISGIHYLALGNSDDEVTIPFLGLVCLGALTLTGFWRRWVVWRPFPKESTGDVLASTMGALLVLTFAFAHVTAMLQSNDVVAIEDRPEGDSLWVFEGYYAWHLLDVIPVLKMPATLNLPAPVNVTDIWAGGTLLFVYKLLVAVPVIGVITQLFAQRHDDAGDDTSDETTDREAADS
jgi:hypothetical protein